MAPKRPVPCCAGRDSTRPTWTLQREEGALEAPGQKCGRKAKQCAEEHRIPEPEGEVERPRKRLPRVEKSIEGKEEAAAMAEPLGDGRE